MPDALVEAPVSAAPEIAQGDGGLTAQPSDGALEDSSYRLVRRERSSDTPTNPRTATKRKRKPGRIAKRAKVSPGLPQVDLIAESALPNPPVPEPPPEPPAPGSARDALPTEPLQQQPRSAQPSEPDEDENLPTQIPPPLQPVPEEPSIVDAPDTDKTEFQRMLEEVEDGFDSILAPGPSAFSDPPAEANSGRAADYDERAVRFLFDEIAANYVRPVRQLMLELKLAAPPREWLDVATPAMTALQRSAEGMGMTELVEACETYLTALTLSAEVAGPTIDEPARSTLFDAYRRLESVLPEAFNLALESGRREPLIIRTVLLQVEGVGKVTIDKIYDAGLTSLEMFVAGKAQDLADATSISLELSERILARFQAYARETEDVVPASRVIPETKLQTLLDDLTAEHMTYESTQGAWSPAARQVRRDVRKQRTETWLQIELLLARVGEVELVSKLEKLPFEERIRQLTSFLDASAERSLTPPETT